MLFAVPAYGDGWKSPDRANGGDYWNRSQSLSMRGERRENRIRLMEKDGDF
jgi:hypothetical protein